MSIEQLSRKLESATTAAVRITETLDDLADKAPMHARLRLENVRDQVDVLAADLAKMRAGLMRATQ